jgi:glycosyltransferase involved in cell wall biosynthesis
MISVLHLLGGEADFQTLRTHQSLCRDLGAGFSIETRTVGRGGDWRDVASAVRGLRKIPGDIVHAWGLSALVAAAIAGSGKIIFSPGTFAPPRTIRWIRSVMSHLNVQMICATATQQRVALERGVPLSSCHVIRPGVDFGRIRRRRDDSLRASLGLKEDDFVLLAPGESTRGAAHEEAVWACGILNVLDARYKLLLWGRGERMGTAERLGRRLHQQDMVKLAEPMLGHEMEFEALLPAVDACLVTAKGPVATLPIAMCMAAALPIISTVTYTVAELLEDRHTALMVVQASPRLLAQRVLDLRAEPNLQWSISDMARTEAYEYFPLTRLLNQYRAVYEQFASGETIEVPEQAAGAGLRFHGRG